MDRFNGCGFPPYPSHTIHVRYITYIWLFFMVKYGKCTVGNGGSSLLGSNIWRIIPFRLSGLITMVIVSPLRIGLWDPFQMAWAFSWLTNGVYQPLTNWDDPPSTLDGRNDVFFGNGGYDISIY